MEDHSDQIQQLNQFDEDKKEKYLKAIHTEDRRFDSINYLTVMIY
jgi:hypothetical protein